MVERVMILDAVLGIRRLLVAESRKLTSGRFFDFTQRDLAAARGLPAHRLRISGRQRTIRCFPDKLPIGIEKDDTSRFVFLYLVNRRLPVDFRQFLIRHAELFRFLHTWTVRLLVPRRFRKAVAALQSGAPRRALDAAGPERHQGAGDVLSRAAGTRGTPWRSGRSRHQRKEFRMQGMAKIAALYRAWRREGDRVLWRSSLDHPCATIASHGCSAVRGSVR